MTSFTQKITRFGSCWDNGNLCVIFICQYGDTYATLLGDPDGNCDPYKSATVLCSSSELEDINADIVGAKVGLKNDE